MILPREVFLSHSSKNKRFAEKLAKVAQAHGVPVWYSDTSLIPAQEWHDQIGSALERCDWFVILLSPPAVQSDWVKRELLYVLRNNSYKDRIVPLVYKTCDYRKLSWVLDGMQMIDFRSNQKEAFRELFRMWGIGYDPTKV